ncbi:MAG: hypothetical protein M3O02_06655 [Acidobacteriota bacterium]|nr:hypothetical protein [Acidobacteriota bacterium]
MPVPILDRILRSFREGARRKRLSLAREWPQAAARVTGFKLVDADPATGASEVQQQEVQQQIEASFYFMLNDDICGGYVRSIPMVRREAARLATGEPNLIVRYNPTDPDELCVLAEDNAGKLPFEIIAG